jgi:hypothetical protein
MDMAPSIDHAMGREHAAALAALPYVPVVVLTLLLTLELGARAGFSPALWLRRAFLATPPAIQLAALGMIISAAVHLALVPSHLSEEPMLGVLFALDGAALLIAAFLSLTRLLPGWRPAAVTLLFAGVLAYIGYVAAGAETADAVGVATKLVELITAGLIALPNRLARPIWRRSERHGPIHLENLEV